jgi:DNA-directed RNA polymerase specialized sigma24 family protein
MTAQKSLNLIRHQQAEKRGGLPAAVSDEADLEAILGREPTPEFAAEVADECRRLLDTLKGENLCQIALLKMEGYENEEIAARLGCALRTVERRLQLIRSSWKEEGLR